MNEQDFLGQEKTKNITDYVHYSTAVSIISFS